MAVSTAAELHTVLSMGCVEFILASAPDWKGS
jgi:hypothetical protein